MVGSELADIIYILSFFQVEAFARSNDVFYEVFGRAMTKVIENTKGVELYSVGGKIFDLIIIYSLHFN